MRYKDIRKQLLIQNTIIMKKRIYISHLWLSTKALHKQVYLFVQNGKAYYECVSYTNGTEEKEVIVLDIPMPENVADELKSLAKINESNVWVDYIPQKARLTPKTYEFVYNCWEQIVAQKPDWF